MTSNTRIQVSNAWRHIILLTPASWPHPLFPTRVQHSHGFSEESSHLLTTLVVPTTHSTLIELLLGTQVPIAACLDALALDTD